MAVGVKNAIRDRLLAIILGIAPTVVAKKRRGFRLGAKDKPLRQMAKDDAFDRAVRVNWRRDDYALDHVYGASTLEQRESIAIEVGYMRFESDMELQERIDEDLEAINLAIFGHPQTWPAGMDNIEPAGLTVLDVSSGGANAVVLEIYYLVTYTTT